MLHVESTRRRARRKVAAPSPSETAIQQSFIAYLDLCAHRDLVYWAVPNGGKRSKVEAARFKAEGVRAGIPDVHFMFRGQFYVLEIKAKKGRVSPDQKVMMERLRLAGAIDAVAHGIDACMAQVKAWGMLKQPLVRLA